MAAGDDGDVKLSVPKFSSFKPKASPADSDAQSARPKSEVRERDGCRRGTSRQHHSPHGGHDDGGRRAAEREDAHRHHNQDRREKSRLEKSRREERHRNHGQRRHKSHREESQREETHRDSRDREHTRQPREESKARPGRTSASSVPGLFVIDKKGDPLIRRYGLERSKVPAYHRLRGGRVLGTCARVFWHHDGPREEFSLLFPGDRKPGSREKGGLGGLGSINWQKHGAIKLRARRGQSPEDTGEDYLSLEKPRKRQRLDADSDSSDADGNPSWRSIEGKAKAIQDVDGNEDVDGNASESDGSSSELAVLDDDGSLKWKSIQLNRRVKDDPHDIEAWLELVDHQDALLHDGETIDRKATENMAHSFTEIKVHLLESALKHASRPDDRQRVLVALIREGVKIWDKDVAAKKWSRLGDEELGNFDLWKTHLEFFMSSIVTFQYESTRTMLLERLEQVVLRSGLESEDDLEEAMYVFLKATKLFRDAGYSELAVAAWQGLLELNLFRPESVQSQSDTLSAFETFWEDEGSRIGEAGAQGWKHQVESGGELGDEIRAVAGAEPAAARSHNSYRAWAAAERAEGKKFSLPARTLDDDTNEDPFRVVMYSDIEPWLFVVPRDRIPRVSRQLIDGFLLFCGLPLAFRSNDWLETAFHDQFLTVIGSGMRPQPVWGTPESPEPLQRKHPSFVSGGYCTRMSPELLFSRANWFQYFEVASSEPAIDPSCTERALKQLVDSTPLPGFGLYYLGFCFATKPDLIRKQAKALLKRCPSNVQLYNGYALAEYANGNVDTATLVLASALESADLSAASTGFLLCKTWSWIELERGDKEAATKRLCASVDGSFRRRTLGPDVISPATILKARQAFAANAQLYLYEGQPETASSHAECLALLAYLTGQGGSEPTSVSQGNIWAAMEAVASISQELQWKDHRNDAASELLFQQASRILYYHAQKGPFRRVFMREQLSRFIARFPRNTMLLNLYGWADENTRVVDETRQLLHDKVLVKNKDSIRSQVFAVQHELASGNVNSTLAAFERAVASDACRHNPGLWAWYVGFCQSQQQVRGQAKGVFYRALAHCPWSKELMMEAFGTLEGGLGQDELRSVYATMEAKGLRIHVELDGFLERRRSKGDETE